MPLSRQYVTSGFPTKKAATTGQHAKVSKPGKPAAPELPSAIKVWAADRYTGSPEIHPLRTAETQLLWLVHDHGMTGHRKLAARAVYGASVISPQFEDRRKKRRWSFIENIISFVPWFDRLNDDPDIAEEEDIRLIRPGAQEEAEARAIAQADADAQAGART